MMTKHKMNLFCGMLLLSASLFVEKAQAMFPERYVSEESAARADTINFRLASAGEAKRLIAAKDSYTANWSPFDIAARLENPEGKREDLVSLAVREVREWTAEEAQQIEQKAAVERAILHAGTPAARIRETEGDLLRRGQMGEPPGMVTAGHIVVYQTGFLAEQRVPDAAPRTFLPGVFIEIHRGLRVWKLVFSSAV